MTTAKNKVEEEPEDFSPEPVDAPTGQNDSVETVGGDSGFGAPTDKTSTTWESTEVRQTAPNADRSSDDQAEFDAWKEKRDTPAEVKDKPEHFTDWKIWSVPDASTLTMRWHAAHKDNVGYVTADSWEDTVSALNDYGKDNS